MYIDISMKAGTLSVQTPVQTKDSGGGTSAKVMKLLIIVVSLLLDLKLNEINPD